MKVVVIGASGLLGQALVAEGGARGLEVVGVSRRSEPSVAVEDEHQLENLIARTEPGLVINAAAEVSLARCEDEPGAAYQVNARPAAILASVCRSREIPFVQVSTDHFFSGAGRARHREDAAVSLLNEYARSKYAGEAFALTYSGSLVVRTNIVGFRGEHGRPTFVEWVISSLAQGARLTLFEDYYTSSLDVFTCAGAIYDLWKFGFRGLINLASAEVASKQEFIEALARRLELPLSATTGSVHGDGTSRLRRADSCGLDVSLAESLLSRKLPGLEEVVSRLAWEHGQSGH